MNQQSKPRTATEATYLSEANVRMEWKLEQLKAMETVIEAIKNDLENMNNGHFDFSATRKALSVLEKNELPRMR